VTGQLIKKSVQKRREKELERRREYREESKDPGVGDERKSESGGGKTDTTGTTR
jgi:hypothetical protein